MMGRVQPAGAPQLLACFPGRCTSPSRSDVISEIKLAETVTAWRTRSLDPVWPIVYFDGIVVHVRGSSGRVSQHTVYVALGVNLKAKKELLGLWLAETEGAKFWLSWLTDLQSRGLSDIFVACISLAHSSCWWRSDSAFPSN